MDFTPGKFRVKKYVKIFDHPEMAFLALIIIIGLEGMHFGHFKKHFIFQVFGQKWPLRRPKMAVFGWNGWTQKCIFLKNTLFKLPENAP